MISAGSLLQSPAKPQSAPTVLSQWTTSEERDACLVELRTAAGTVYLCPSGWQRIRLQWAFRHFRVLPPQVLSRGDQRLIEKLCQSAVVTPALPVPRNTIFGVVEKAPWQPATVSKLPEVPTPSRSGEAKPVEIRLYPWGALTALAAASITVTLVWVYGAPLFFSTVRASNAHTLSTPAQQAAGKIKPPAIHAAASSLLAGAPPTASLLDGAKPKRWIAPPPPEPTLAQQDALPKLRAAAPVSDSAPQPVAIAAAAPSERRFVEELPQGHFAHPVASEPNLVGELRLNVLVGADGSVKDVTVVSGSPKLAKVGMRAVRQWHYAPYQVLGSPVEVETQVRMSFFGEDAISVGAVAEGSASQLQ